jgi:hypothetical protein
MQHNSGSNEANGSKPSLMSKPSFNTKPGVDAQEPSILSSVKGAPAVATTSASKASKFKIFTLGVLAVAAAYFGYQYMLASQQPSKPNLKANVIIDEKADEAFKSPSAVAKLPSAPMDTSATVAAVAPEAAAQIINEPAPVKPAAVSAAASAGAGTSPESKITTALEDGVKPPPAALEKALASSVPAKTPGQSAVASKAPPAKVVADAGSGKPAAASPSNNPAGNKPASTATAPSADKDVNLIAALLSHGTGATPKSKTAAAPNTTSTSKQAGAPAAAAAATTTAEPANASLDATTLALKQCGELGFLEREVCRIKTCNNQWETNAACKATMSTASARP